MSVLLLKGISDARIEVLLLEGSRIIATHLEMPERHPTDYEFSQDEKLSLQWYLRLRLEDDHRWLKSKSFEQVASIYQIATLIESSQFGEFSIDSPEYRKSRLHCIPSETIFWLAEKAGLSLPESRRLSLVDLVACAREKLAGPKCKGNDIGDNSEKVQVASSELPFDTIVEDALSGCPKLLARFRYIKKCRHAVQFETTADDNDLWDKSEAERDVNYLKRGWKLLQTKLNSIKNARCDLSLKGGTVKLNQH